MSSPWPYGEASFLEYLNIKILVININDWRFDVRLKVACGILFC